MTAKPLKCVVPAHGWLTVAMMADAAPDLFTRSREQPSATTSHACDDTEMVTQKQEKHLQQT